MTVDSKVLWPDLAHFCRPCKGCLVSFGAQPALTLHHSCLNSFPWIFPAKGQEG